ncbi:MAG: hypothetical protein CEE38_10515 [Planctomycetes bacterium B3_Pla]|nr:MAG: hypothetical protein CEE38_10515 [Planctomycetes bacterium B3_Pla]
MLRDSSNRFLGAKLAMTREHISCRCQKRSKLTSFNRLSAPFALCVAPKKPFFLKFRLTDNLQVYMIDTKRNVNLERRIENCENGRIQKEQGKSKKEKGKKVKGAVMSNIRRKASP